MVDAQEKEKEIEERLLKWRRCAKVVKGGRRFSFNVLAAVGNKKGLVGIGYGKANEMPDAIRKAFAEGRKHLVQVALCGTTIPHEIRKKYGSSVVFMKPASPGTGIKAGAVVRTIAELAGITDLLSKVYGSTNALNVAKAAFECLKSLRSKKQVEELRGRKVI